MKRLEDIPKKQIFEVPDGYFEKLPAIIQSRVTSQQQAASWSPAFRYTLRFAVPAVILLVAGIFWFNNSPTDLDAESMLSAIQTEDLISYLNEGDITTEELLEHVDLDAEDVSTIEESVYEFQFSDADIEDIFNEIEQ